MRLTYTITLLVLSSILAMGFVLTPQKNKVDYDLVNAKINWLTWEEALSKNEQEPRKIMVDIYTHWCGWCKRMDASTFNQTDIADYINANYYAIKFNAELTEDIEFKGKTYSYTANGKRGYHALAAEITNGMLSYPTTVFLDENLNHIQAIKGYKDAQSFEQIITYFGGDNHKKMPWESYQRNYKSLHLSKDKKK